MTNTVDSDRPDHAPAGSGRSAAESSDSGRAGPVPGSVALIRGAADSPVILHVPHSARHIPAVVRADILLTDPDLARELDLITDAHTAELAAAASRLAACPPWQFVNRLSRLVIDPERFPDEREEMLAVGMGAVYTRTTHRNPLRACDFDPEELLDRYFHPYARSFTGLVEERLSATGRAVILDVHSYPTAALPYELHGGGPRPPICLGVDSFHTPAELIGRAAAAFGDFGGTEVNTPFAGTYVPLAHYGTDSRVTALMLEIRRDIYMTEPGGPSGPGLPRLAAALATLIDALT
ncbi:N-formylglutamate amidohydrolase [Nocardia huaxiensis]|uniref:N-formylglutamate amidohydrolase n=1 Tax=Nocardia huaxiensis TaxID=2755382 RepID=UPI001E609CB4|nr:N-formylglutamate amidohydrolase [Nocardia huaxiensis]UFS96563.1 N-formylglutamate amidohydrolase [Nocardia huaxiensis]